MRPKLLLLVHAFAIIAVIAVLAWSKARGITVALPYFPRTRRSLPIKRSLSF